MPSKQVTIPPLNKQIIKLTLVGDTPLVTHAWSQKAKQEMLDKQMKKAKGGKAAKDPWSQCWDAAYWISDKPENATEDDITSGSFGAPVLAFKNAAVTACTSIGSMTKVAARQAFHVLAEARDSSGTMALVPIEGSAPIMDESMVRIGMGTADLRYRPMFVDWKCSISVVYNADLVSAEQVVHLYNTAGFAVGICEHRPEKNGSWGMFHVEVDDE